MGVININVQLSIEIKDREVLAHLLFSNNTTNRLYIDRYTTCLDGQFRNEVFQISDERGRKISYTGPLVKRKIKREDFVLLEVGENVSSTVTLNEVYSLTKGKKYLIQFSAFNPGLEDDGPLVDMESNMVKVLYK